MHLVGQDSDLGSFSKTHGYQIKGSLFPSLLYACMFACKCTCLCVPVGKLEVWSMLFRLDWLASKPLYLPSVPQGWGTALCLWPRFYVGDEDEHSG